MHFLVLASVVAAVWMFLAIVFGVALGKLCAAAERTLPIRAPRELSEPLSITTGTIATACSYPTVR